MNISAAETTLHPLDPASAEELHAAVALLRNHGELSDEAVFSCGFAAEPAKETVLSYAPGDAFDRRIRLCGHDHGKRRSFDAYVSLSNDEVSSFSWVEDGQASVTLPDMVRLYEILYANADWLAALEKRNITNFDLLHIEPWLAGVRPDEMDPHARVINAIAFLHEHPDDNYYARPVEGLLAKVDVDSGQCIVEDHGVRPIPKDPAEYAADRVESLRDDLKPLEITQPEGPSFEVEGQVIRWQRWHLRVSANPIEGLVLHDVRYNDQGRDRQILYRASLSDMVVPYGDRSPMHRFKHAFDAGETALGHQANSLKLGCDCLGEIHYFSSTFLKHDGEAREVENTICLHEEDYGVLWKHTNTFHPEPTPEVRRSRRLVVSMFHTVGNYEYGFFWYFYMDGTIQMEVKLTGMIGVSVETDGKGSDTAPMVSPELSSPIHQHLFCFRLDFDLDGSGNSVVETDVELNPAEDNPFGTYFRAVPTVLSTEQAAMRDADPARSRTWRVVNPNSTNAIGNPVSYKLLPNATPVMYATPESAPGRRGGFARHNLWVTPYSEDELYADAGPFTYLQSGAGGLSDYVAADREIEDTDLVVWHTFGVTHVPRPEDWPVMPVEYAGFTLLPVGFFDRNPAIDVAPQNHCHD